MSVQFKIPSLIPLDAVKVSAELDALIKRDGLLDPQAIVVAAERAQSSMHEYFYGQSASEIADRWRRERAARLIRAMFHKDENGKLVRLYSNVRTGKGRGYLPTKAALKVPKLREQILNDAMRAMQSFDEKFGVLSELADAIKVHDRLRKRYDKHYDERRPRPH